MGNLYYCFLDGASRLFSDFIGPEGSREDNKLLPLRIVCGLSTHCLLGFVMHPAHFNRMYARQSSMTMIEKTNGCFMDDFSVSEFLSLHALSHLALGKGAHYGYNCPPQIPIISKPEPCNNQTVNEFPQTLPSVQPTSCTGGENSFTYDSKPSFVDDSPNVFNPPPQLPMYSCEFCGNDARYGHYFIQKKEEEKRIAEEQAAKDRYWKIPICYDDDEDDTIAITPVLSTEEPVNSLSMGDEHLDTIPETESDEFIKSSVEILVPIPSESEGVPEMCDVPFHDNSPPLDISKDQFEDFSESNDVSTSSDDDSPYGEDIDYVDASPPDVEIVSLEVVGIVDPEVGRIDDDILLTIKDDILREKLLNVNLLIAKIDALRDNPTPSSDVVTKSTSTFSNLFLEETNTFDNSVPESETFRFNLEEISSGSPTTRSDLSLPDFKAFYVDNDHFKEKSSGSTTTHVDFSRYDSFIFDLSNDQFPPADRSDLYHEEFTDELTHIMSLPNLECFKFKIEPDPGDLTSIDPGIRKNVSTTNVINH
ncbi:hypothetical protein Tco_0978518 [Tanacetum coccineum]|uniref:Uncharacterized protein n=1 Tax=Tanacetum coccineum TaxID=301880 RepID=A0ABQ5EN82_9ASTR